VGGKQLLWGVIGDGSVRRRQCAAGLSVLSVLSVLSTPQAVQEVWGPVPWARQQTCAARQVLMAAAAS